MKINTLKKLNTTSLYLIVIVFVVYLLATINNAKVYDQLDFVLRAIFLVIFAYILFVFYENKNFFKAKVVNEVQENSENADKEV